MRSKGREIAMVGDGRRWRETEGGGSCYLRHLARQLRLVQPLATRGQSLGSCRLSLGRELRAPARRRAGPPREQPLVRAHRRLLVRALLGAIGAKVGDEGGGHGLREVHRNTEARALRLLPLLRAAEGVGVDEEGGEQVEPRQILHRLHPARWGRGRRSRWRLRSRFLALVCSVRAWLRLHVAHR